MECQRACGFSKMTPAFGNSTEGTVEHCSHSTCSKMFKRLNIHEHIIFTVFSRNIVIDYLKQNKVYFRKV